MPLSAPIMTGSPSHLASNRRSHRAGLILIALYKLLGALSFITIGVGALKLLHKDIDDVVWHALIDVLRMNPESHVVNFVFEKAELLNDPILKRIGFAAFCYAALGVAEAIGLYLEKAWAEILTLIITASFLPLEIHEMIKRLTWVRASVLAVNVAVLVYLIWVIFVERAQRARAAKESVPA
ncbi:MAG TPA: DUF2127 domain-containing protein [Terracidiphilus sp.]|nr:DUF2127 domain-containing protein [Terracidiphilus sp.]